MMIATAIKRVHVMGAGAERISSVERRALPHIESCLRWIERLWTSDEQLPDFKLRLAWTILGSVCEHQGKLQEARRLVILATRGSIWESLRIPSGVDWHGALRRDDERRQAHCDALHDEIKDRPITNPMSVLATLDLAASHLEQANYKQAKGLYKSLLMTIEQTQSPNSPDALRLVEHLANTYQSSGQSEQSQMLFERQLLAVEDQYGFDSAVSRSVSRDLVQACELFGHYSRAERLVRRGMLADEERLGPEHPTVLRSLGHLAVLADEQGHFEESEALFARAISGYKKVYGDDHSVTLNACENLALSYRLRGRRDQAEILLWSNFETRTRVPGGRSDLLRTVERLTAILEEQGKREEARSLREKFPEQCARDMCAISVSSI
jgi:tetratricopeptide (TPR) repeat protein